MQPNQKSTNQRSRNNSFNIELQDRYKSTQAQPPRPLSFSFDDPQNTAVRSQPQPSLTLPIFPFISPQNLYYPRMTPQQTNSFSDQRRTLLDKFSQRFNNLRQVPQNNFVVEDPTSSYSQARSQTVHNNLQQHASEESSNTNVRFVRTFEQLNNSVNIQQHFETAPNANNNVANTSQAQKIKRMNSLGPEDAAFWDETDYSEIDGLNIQSKLVKLKNLNNLLVQVFCGVEVEVGQYNLNDFEENILNSLLMRKFFKRLKDERASLSIEEKTESLNEIIKIKSAKRPEEFYKFVLTRVIKMLKRDFRSKLNSSAKNFERDFYDYYFKEAAEINNIPIEQFYYPLTGKACKKKDIAVPFNNLNSEYYEKIFRSDKFVAEMGGYLDALHNDYHREIIKKLESLLVKWDAELQDEKGDYNKIQKKIADYLEKNKRCKLPWTLNEVDEAIARFKNHVAHIRANNKN